jgi:hypothetical protein
MTTLNLFLRPEITDKQTWFEFDTNYGLESINPDILPMYIIENLNSLNVDSTNYLQNVLELVEDYISGTVVYGFECVVKYGCRTSASGFLDCTEWSTFSTKNECYKYLADVLDISVYQVKKNIRNV